MSGRPELVLVSTERERQIGQEEARKVEQSVGLVDDEALRAWVEGIGARLAGHSPRQDVSYHFYVLDSPDPNAFALPGGHVYVSRGLLALVNEEDELANVLGHEIAHVAARHAVRRITVATPFALLTGIPALLTGIVSPALGEGIAGAGALVGGLVLAPYSRDQEREADRLGMELAARGGWDPGAMSRFLTTLERDERAAGPDGGLSWFATHPATADRVRTTAAHAAQIERGPKAPDAGDRPALLARLEGLLLGDDPRQGVFVDDLFLHPELDLAVRFPKGWQTHNARDYVAAVAPDREAFASLHVAAEGDDPLAGARADGVDQALAQRLEPLEVAGHRALRLEVAQQGDTLMVTWVARRGLVYRFTGAGSTSGFEKRRAAFDAFVQSMRPLGSDRDRILEGRLQVWRAREGESLPGLVARAGSRWSPEQTAISNALDPEVRLEPGQRIKLEVPRPYRESS